MPKSVGNAMLAASRRKSDNMKRAFSAAFAVLLSTSALQAQQYSTEQQARECIHKRLSELISQDQRRDVMSDPAIIACTNTLKDELQRKGKSNCESVDYTAWLVRNENSKLAGVSGSPYKEDKSFIEHCKKSTTRKHSR